MEPKDILLLVAGAVISLIINYITQYTSIPLAQKYTEWRNKQAQKKAIESVENAKRRIEKIEKELVLIKWYVENPVAFNAFAFDMVQNLFRKIFFFALLAVGSVVMPDATAKLVILVMLFFFLFYSNGSMDAEKKVDHIFRKVKNFQVYELEMQKQIAELQEAVKNGSLSKKQFDKEMTF